MDAAVAGDEIVVTDGIYSSGVPRETNRTWNRVVVDKPLMLRSVNGPQLTIIDGERSVRCVYLANNASLSGFTLRNGFVGELGLTIPIVDGVGGGVRCAAQSSVVSNCVITGNVARTYGTGGGAYGGTLNNCTLVGNSSQNGSVFCVRVCNNGGGAAMCILNNCTLANNSAAAGGGASGSTLNNCTLIGNFGGDGGGAVGGTLNNCTLSGNSGQYGGGANGSTLNNCALTGNSASSSGGGAAGCLLNNCTLFGNSASVGGGASYAIGDEERPSSMLNNCIVYFNTALQGPNYGSSSLLNYSCTTPLPTNGAGNITNEPAFVNLAAGNYRLRPDSPCIDAGTNLSASITNDLDGRPRPLDGNGDGLAAFDMGAYEYRTPLLVWQDSPNATPPHADWATAAHAIQDAVDAALAGDEIVVTNGIYATGVRSGNRVAVDKPLSLRSVNGPQFTIINGGQSNRCVYLTNEAGLAGFTLTNGRAHCGGGLWCESTSGVVSNCLVSGNSTFGSGVPVICGNLGCDGPALSPAFGGDGDVSPAFAAGVYGGTLKNCILSNNRAETYVYVYIEDPLFPWLRRYYYFPGSGGGAGNATLNNCTLTGNSAGYGGGAYQSTLNNCTLTGNSASIDGGGASWCPLNNCIAYFNTSTNGANYDSSCILNYSCTTPQPTNGLGNITNAPLFVDQASGNVRLQSNSPCINAGLNAFAPAGPDLDGNPRIMAATVDMGAYEFQTITLVNSAKTPSGAFQFSFTARPNRAYTVLAATNLALPLAKWTAFALMPEFSPGLYLFSNTQAADSPQMFYLVVEGNYYRQHDRGCPPYPNWFYPDAYVCIHPFGGSPYWSAR